MDGVHEDFRKTVRKALIDKGKTIGWLAGEINAATGKHFETGYLGKVFAGQRGSKRVIEETCRILDLEPPDGYRQ